MHQTTAVVVPDRPMPLPLLAAIVILVQLLPTMRAAHFHLAALLHPIHGGNFRKVHDPTYQASMALAPILALDLLDQQCHSPTSHLRSRKSSSVTYAAKSITRVPARFASRPVPTLRLTPQSLRDVDFLTLPQSTITSNTTRSITCSTCSVLWLVGSRREEIIFHVLDIIQDIRNVFLIEKTDDSEGK